MGLTALFYASRFIRISGLTVGFLLAFLANKIFRLNSGPQLLRKYLQTCGGGFVKVGQLLSIRLDVLSPEYQDELSRLLDCMPAVDVGSIRKIIEADLGRTVDSCFARINSKPVASASVAQVHFATRLNGEKVAIKVKRPGVEREFRADLFYLVSLSKLVASFGFFSSLDLVGLIGELARLTTRELDFRSEAINTQHLHELFEGDCIDHCAPRVHFDLCGKQVLTMQRLIGVPLKALLTAVEQYDLPRLDRWAERGISPHRTARILFRSLLEQSLCHRVFHADPHMANLIVLDGGTLAFVDFGIVGRVDENSSHKLSQVFWHMSRGNVHATYTALLRAAQRVPRKDLTSLENELKLIIADWSTAAQSAHATHLEKSNGRVLFRIMDAMRRSGVRFRWDIVALFRTTFISDKIVYTLYPDMDPVCELTEFFKHQHLRQAAEELRPEMVRSRLLLSYNSVMALPETLHYLTDLARARVQAEPIPAASIDDVVRGVATVCDSIKLAAWMAVLACITLKLLLGAGWLAGGPTAFAGFVNNFWWLIAVGFAAIALITGNAARRLRRQAEY